MPPKLLRERAKLREPSGARSCGAKVGVPGGRLRPPPKSLRGFPKTDGRAMKKAAFLVELKVTRRWTQKRLRLLLCDGAPASTVSSTLANRSTLTHNRPAPCEGTSVLGKRFRYVGCIVGFVAKSRPTC